MSVMKRPIDSVVLLSSDKRFRIRLSCALLASGVRVCAYDDLGPVLASIQQNNTGLVLVDTLPILDATLRALEQYASDCGFVLVCIRRNRRRVYAVESNRSGEGLASTEGLRRLSALIRGYSWKCASIHGLKLYMDELRLVQGDGAAVRIPERELELLRLLCQLRGESATTRAIFDALWGRAFGSMTSVAVHVFRLRRRLQRVAGDAVIRSQRRKGYYIPKELIRLS